MSANHLPESQYLAGEREAELEQIRREDNIAKAEFRRAVQTAIENAIIAGVEPEAVNEILASLYGSHQ